MLSTMLSRKESQLHMRLSDDDRARLDALISTLNRQHAVPGRPFTRTDAMRFALHKAAELTATTEQAAPA